MFDKATNPDRVLCRGRWQFIQGEGRTTVSWSETPAPAPKVRQKLVNARFSQGVCWARAQTQSVVAGEEYTLQIDSHTRFEPDWDQN